MKKIFFSIFCISLFLFTISASSIYARMESTNYVIWADVFSSGGGEDSTSANYGLQDTIGEAIILSATSTSANYGTKVGFREMYTDQYITFSIADGNIDLGTLGSSVTGSDSNQMVVATNASGGFTITVSGLTLTSGVNTINAIGASALASAVGTEQFGINLVSNSSPSIGADAAGTSPIGTAANQYNTANLFAFNSGATVATSTSQINQTTYTVSYIANISSATEPGTYTTTLTYSATANF